MVYASIVLAALASALPPSPTFMKYWKSGLAEISTYQGLEERYGELRQATTLMVFVYEEIDDKTRIKVESDKIPLKRQVPVLKLNRLLRFNTGIYDYSVMTSLFSGLSGPGVTKLFETKKISLTAQEWCGQVFWEAIPRTHRLESKWQSYFEAEGEGQSELAIPAGEVVYEDELPIRLRELEGPIVPNGKSSLIQLYPALWQTRKRHTPPRYQIAELKKIGEGEFKVKGQPRPAILWELSLTGKPTTTYAIEPDGQKRVLGWRVTNGEFGEIHATVRKTYWEQHKNQDEGLRGELGLPQGPLLKPVVKLSPK